MEIKLCKDCKEEKSLVEFYWNKSRENFNSYCKTCSKVRSTEWRNKNPEKHREYIRKHRGCHITKEEYEDIFYVQGGVCAVCGNASNESLSVDHCHVTGEIRGLLCQECNIGIGKLGDNYEGVKKALDYLEKFECDES